MIKRSDIRVRDPFIVAYEGFYYMYATSGTTTLSVYRSRDLQNWEEGGVVFNIPEDSWAYKDVWAAEVHRYDSRFYLFVSLLGKNGLRGTQVAVADMPWQTFTCIANKPITPSEMSCIDATLFTDEVGTPYIIYSHDWPDNYVMEKSAYVGEIWAAEVDKSLTSIIGEPFRLFASCDSPISAATPHHITYNGHETLRYGSDAPFVQRLIDGRLLLTWSPYLQNNYVVLPVISDSGSIRGPWVHLEKPLYSQNGGHAMFFTDLEGKLKMCLHAPEIKLQERAHIFDVGERDGEFVVLNEI